MRFNVSGTGECRPWSDGAVRSRRRHKISKPLLPILGRLFFEAVVERSKTRDIEMLQGLVRRAVKNEPPPVNHCDLIHEIDIFHHVGGANGGAAGVGQLAKKLHELCFSRWIESARWFVQEENSWTRKQFRADAD